MGTDELYRGPGSDGGAPLEGTEPTVDEVARESTEAEATSRLASIQPRRFGKYNLIGKLGHGGMAKVLLAYVDGPGDVKKLVVVKRIHRHLQSSPQHVKMFLDEARLAARMNHPNVVQTYELGEIRGSHFMALEYLEGQSFDRIWRLSSGGGNQLSFPLIARVFADALDGLHYAHEIDDFDGRPLGVVHRDVSPQNIFVTYDGATKLLDFGVAKAVTQDSNTESGMLKGKCSYVAPEQAHGQSLDRRADIWSIGVMFWESLVGRRLFKSANDAATLIDVLTATIPLVREIRTDVPEDLSEVARRALQRNRDRRYPTAKAMRDDLHAYLVKQGEAGSREALAAFMREAFAKNAEKHRLVVEACLAAAEHRDLDPDDPRIPRRVRGPAALPADPPEEETHPAASVLADPGASADAGTKGREPTKRPSDHPSGVGGRSGRLRAVLGTAVPLLIVVGLGIAGAVVLQRGGRRAGSRSGDDDGALRLDGALATGSGGGARGPAGPDGGAPAPALEAGAQALEPELRGVDGGGPGSGGHEDGGLDASGVDAAGTARPGEADSGSVVVPGERGPGAGASPRAPAPQVAPEGPAPRPDRSHAVGAPSASPRRDGGAAGRDAGAAAAPRPPTAPASPGFLSLDTTPWTQVRLGGRVLGETPLIRRPLAPGTYEITLVNTERGIRTTITVEIVSGETTTRRLAVR